MVQCSVSIQEAFFRAIASQTQHWPLLDISGLLASAYRSDSHWKHPLTSCYHSVELDFEMFLLYKDWWPSDPHSHDHKKERERTPLLRLFCA